MKSAQLGGLIAAGVLFFVTLPAGAEELSAPKDRACVLDCREAHGACTQAAFSEARSCIQGCEGLIATAREVCAAEPDSEECAAARSEAAACVRACRRTLRADLRACFGDAKECVSECPDAEPPVPSDPICLGECRRQARACLERAGAAARECAEPCGEFVGKAGRVCFAAPRSDRCAQARREANACLQPCREQLASDTRQCVAAGQRCAASCPPAVSDTATRPASR
jgi:hypothetical protein